MERPPDWDRTICLRCVACVGICPSRALAFRSNSIMIDPVRCSLCGACVRSCPVGCLKE